MSRPSVVQKSWTPKVSVVIPAYNAASTVVRAVESALNQTYTNIEIIVVDDGSTDSTRRLLDPYTSRISYVSQNNRGRSAARNLGISHASGEYIAFLDADDWWLPEKLMRQVKFLEEDKAVGLVHTAFYFVEPNGKCHKLALAQRLDSPGAPIFEQLVMRNTIGSPTFVMVRTSVLHEVGVFDESLRGTEDWDLWLRIAAEYSVAYVAEPLACYQLHGDDPIARLVSRNAGTDWIRIIDKLFSHPRIKQRHGHLEHLARARVLLRSSLIDCTMSSNDQGSEKLELAVQLDPTLFLPPSVELDDWIIEFANKFGEQRPPLQSALEFIDCFWDMLPASLEAGLGHQRHVVKVRLCAERFFEAHRRQDWQAVRSSGLRTVWLDPSWLRNVGFISIWVESILGTRVADFVRSQIARLRV